MKNPTRSLIAALALAAAPAAHATDVADGKLSINGNGAWAYGRTDANEYILADSDGDYATALFDLVLTARPDDNLVIASQVCFDADEVELDWGFAEWRFSDAARVRAGKVRQPLGNYMEYADVGTLRPFYTLPTSVYGPANMGASAYWGAGVTGTFHLGDAWSLQYDAYGGALELDTREPYEVLVDPTVVDPTDPMAPWEDEVLLAENLVGGRLSLSTPWNVTFRLSGWGGARQVEGETEVVGAEEDSSSFMVLGASVQYRGDKLWLSGEAFQSRDFGDETQLGTYAEAAYFLTPHVQLAARYELARVDLEDFDGGSTLLRHNEAALGVNYWFKPQLVVKASVHQVVGSRFTMPEPGETPDDDHTLLFVAGAQFTF